jgi:hypothetical protein
MAYLYDAWEEKRCVPEVEAFYQSRAGLSSLGSHILEWIALCIRPRTEFPNSNHGKTKYILKYIFLSNISPISRIRYWRKGKVDMSS